MLERVTQHQALCIELHWGDLRIASFRGFKAKWHFGQLARIEKHLVDTFGEIELIQHIFKNMQLANMKIFVQERDFECFFSEIIYHIRECRLPAGVH